MVDPAPDVLPAHDPSSPARMSLVHEEEQITVMAAGTEAGCIDGTHRPEMTGRKLRIFISSPGDVGQERLIATRVLDRLQGEFWGIFELEPIVWEHEPLRASAHFQEQIL